MNDEYSNIKTCKNKDLPALIPTPPTGQVLFALSQDSPVLMQCGPRMLGDTSPRFDEAKAATKGPCQEKQPVAFYSFFPSPLIQNANIPSDLVNYSEPFVHNRKKMYIQYSKEIP